MDAATREVLTARSRSRRSNRPGPGRRLERAYVVVLALAVPGAMLVSGGAGLLAGGGCTGGAGCLDPAGRPALAAAVALAGWAVLWRTAVRLGPVGAGRAQVAFPLSTPAHRRTLLLPAAARAGVLATASGGLLGRLVLAAWDPVPASTAVVLAVVTGAGLGLGTVALAVSRQPGRRGPASPLPGRAALVAAGACAVAVLVPLGPPGRWLPTTVPALTVASLVLGVALAGCVLAVSRLGNVPRPELAGAGDAQEGVRGSVLLLDASHASRRLRGRRRDAGRARSRRGRGVGGAALLHREALQLLRRPGRLVAATGLLVVPVLTQLLAGTTSAVVVAVLVALPVGRSFSGALLVVGGSGGLARSLPLSVLRTSTLLLVVPAVVVLTWSAAATALLGLPGWATVAVAAAALAGVVRGASAPDATGTGPMLMTEAGPVPLGLVARTVRGPDVVLLAVAPLLLQAGPVASVVLPLVVLVALLERGSRAR